MDRGQNTVVTKPELVTFDCAGTLLRVRWSPGAFARDCAIELGIDASDADVEFYDRTLRSRWPEYREVNQTRDSDAGDRFWRRLAQDWLTHIGHGSGRIDDLLAVADEKMYGLGSTVFEPFDDVLPTLDRLDALGCRVAVISNWDYSLHRILRSRGLAHRFELVVASLEEGVEKPNVRLFQLALDRCGVVKGRAAHVGDDPIDDFRGAQDAGMIAILVDRTRNSVVGHVVPSLTDVPGVLGW